MTFFTLEEFTEKYPDYNTTDVKDWNIEAACEMIFSQVGLRFRSSDWDAQSVPTAIKNASMEQLRFILEHDIPYVDSDKVEQASMKSTLKSDYSTLALRMLANAGYLYRGNPINTNMSLNIPFGD